MQSSTQRHCPLLQSGIRVARPDRNDSVTNWTSFPFSFTSKESSIVLSFPTSKCNCAQPKCAREWPQATIILTGEDAITSLLFFRQGSEPSDELRQHCSKRPSHHFQGSLQDKTPLRDSTDSDWRTWSGTAGQTWKNVTVAQTHSFPDVHPSPGCDDMYLRYRWNIADTIHSAVLSNVPMSVTRETPAVICRRLLLSFLSTSLASSLAKMVAIEFVLCRSLWQSPFPFVCSFHGPRSRLRVLALTRLDSTVRSTSACNSRWFVWRHRHYCSLWWLEDAAALQLELLKSWRQKKWLWQALCACGEVHLNKEFIRSVCLLTTTGQMFRKIHTQHVEMRCSSWHVTRVTISVTWIEAREKVTAKIGIDPLGKLIESIGRLINITIHTDCASAEVITQSLGSRKRAKHFKVHMIWIHQLMKQDATCVEKITSLEKRNCHMTRHVPKSISHTFPATCNFLIPGYWADEKSKNMKRRRTILDRES